MDLSNCPFDLCLDNRRIPFDVSSLPKTGNFDDKVGNWWVELVNKRYVTREFSQRCMMRRAQLDLVLAELPTMKLTADISAHPRWALEDVEISRQIYAGLFWFHANSKAVDYLLDNPVTKRLAYYYRDVRIPEESFFHTVLCNNAQLSISPHNHRYEDWSNGGSHPKWLEQPDIDKCIQSGAYFARKFCPNGDVKRFVNQTILHAR